MPKRIDRREEGYELMIMGTGKSCRNESTEVWANHAEANRQKCREIMPKLIDSKL